MRPGLTFLILLLVSSSKAEQYLLDTVTGWKAKCSGEKKKKTNCPVTPQKDELLQIHPHTMKTISKPIKL